MTNLMTFPINMIGAVLSYVAYQAAIVISGFFALAFHFLWIGALFGEMALLLETVTN